MSLSSKRIPDGMREAFIHALVILPAVLLGTLAMIHGGISPALWGQQIAACVVLALLSWPLKRVFKRIPAAFLCILLLLFLAAALLGAEIGGARRWVDLGVFNIHAALLVLPALLTALWRVKSPYSLLLGAAVILCAQPSPVQLTAFAAGALPLLWQRKQKLWGIGSLVLMGLLAFSSFLIPVRIEPVSYCEGILTMLGEMSPLLQAAGWISLAAVPLFWLIRFLRKGSLQSLSIAIYFALSLFFVFLGEYPVPFMGFGLSPIAGYYFACIVISTAEAKENGI